MCGFERRSSWEDSSFEQNTWHFLSPRENLAGSHGKRGALPYLYSPWTRQLNLLTNTGRLKTLMRSFRNTKGTFGRRMPKEKEVRRGLYIGRWTGDLQEMKTLHVTSDWGRAGLSRRLECAV